MKSFRFNNGITAVVPEDWDIDNSDSLISIYEPKNGVGALQISFFKAKNSDQIYLVQELEEYLDDKYEDVNIWLIDNYAYCSLIDEDNIYWRYWLFLK